MVPNIDYTKAFTTGFMCVCVCTRAGLWSIGPALPIQKRFFTRETL